MKQRMERLDITNERNQINDNNDIDIDNNKNNDNQYLLFLVANRFDVNTSIKVLISINASTIAVKEDGITKEEVSGCYNTNNYNRSYQ